MTVQSYHGALDFGLTACRRTVPELRKLADYLEESLDELHEAVLGVSIAPKPAAVRAPAARKRAAPAAAASRRRDRAPQAERNEERAGTAAEGRAREPCRQAGAHLTQRPHSIRPDPFRPQPRRRPW